MESLIVIKEKKKRCKFMENESRRLGIVNESGLIKPLV